MQLDGMAGLHGWQWMFLLEGLPTVVIGCVLYFILPDRPTDVKWLTPEESRSLEAHAVIDAHGHAHLFSGDWVSALKRPTTLCISLIYFLNQIAFVGLYFFTPSIVSQMNVKSPVLIAILSSSVGFGFLVGVMLLPRIHRRMQSDCVYLRIVTTGQVVAALAFISTSNEGAQIALLAAAGFFGGGVLPSYWSIAMKRLHGVQAAAGLAFINTIGLLGGFVGPYLFGLAEAASGKSSTGFYVILAAAVLGLILIPILARASVPRASRWIPATLRQQSERPASRPTTRANT